MSTTVYDRSWKGTPEQFVLHFHEQFRELDEVTPLDEQLPHSVRLTLLQTAVRSVPELRIVDTMEEYMFLTNCYSSHCSITSDKYFTMLQNACIRYDKSLKQKTSSTARAVYHQELDEDSGTDGDKGAMLQKDLCLMELTLHLMTATTSTLPTSIGTLRSSP